MRLLVVLALLVAACGSADEEGPKPFSSRSSASSDDGDDDDDDDDSVDAKAKTKRDNSAESETPAEPMTYVRNHAQAWVGTIKATPQVDFGGGDFCNYHVVLTNIRVQVTFDPRGNITASNISNTTTETAPQCKDAPLGVQTNHYIVQTPDAPLESLSVQFQPNADNLPQAEISLSLDPVDANHIKGHLVVQRIGGVEDSLNWSLDTDVELTPLGS